MRVTYKQLAEEILDMDEQQQNSPVMIYIAELNEYCPLDLLSYVTRVGHNADDHNQPILNVGIPTIKENIKQPA